MNKHGGKPSNDSLNKTAARGFFWSLSSRNAVDLNLKYTTKINIKITNLKLNHQARVSGVKAYSGLINSLDDSVSAVTLNEP
jgi:hypothetical protein